MIEYENGKVKTWTDGVPFEDSAKEQTFAAARLPFVGPWVAVMPDVHGGIGATVGSVIPTEGAIIPAAVGVDIGCGMVAVRTDLRAEHLPDNLGPIRSAIEAAVPHGRTDDGGPNDRGAWSDPPEAVRGAWASLEAMRPVTPEKLKHRRALNQLGTLGTGNHFIEVCLDEVGDVWIMLHSGSRGQGNAIGSHYIALAKREMERWFVTTPYADLAYLPEGSQHFDAYMGQVRWAQEYARTNRNLMLAATMGALGKAMGREIATTAEAVNCHHNYVARERHFKRELWVTRKGAVSARDGEMGIIPGSMGARSFIVRGKGNPLSFCSCSHGAGRAMSRTEAKRRFTLADHEAATVGVECRKDADVIDETPAAYKSIDAVMAAQADLVEIVHTLKQVVCVKG